MELHENVEYVMLTKEQIAARVKELGRALTKDYAGKKPILVCILKGSIHFFSDLIREMELDLTVDFMAVSSYGSSTTSSGILQIKKDLTENITGKDVILVEDIIDSGNTLYNLKNMLLTRSPASVKIVTLLDKPDRRVSSISPEYTGFVIEDEFVIGYGLDYAEEYRNLPYIGVLKRSLYE